MRTVNTFNIFEASLYLTDLDSRLVNIGVAGDGRIFYTINGTHGALESLQEEFTCGLSYIHLDCYLSKFKKLYKESRKLSNDESFLIQGGAL